MQRLPESELDIMLALWEASGDEVPRTYFDEQLAHRNWTVNTINSFLSRLQDKGFVSSVRKGKTNLYTALIRREDYLEHEGKSILQKLYCNSLKNFLLSVSATDGIEEDEIIELQKYLGQLKGGCNNDK